MLYVREKILLQPRSEMRSGLGPWPVSLLRSEQEMIGDQGEGRAVRRHLIPNLSRVGFRLCRVRKGVFFCGIADDDTNSWPGEICFGNGSLKKSTFLPATAML
jgi:hypothetical protein